MINMISKEKINRVLPTIFKRVKVPRQAKEELRRRLFQKEELTDEKLSLIAAAGDLTEQTAQQKILKNGGNHNDTHRKI